MCYLKNLNLDDSQDFAGWPSKDQELSQPTNLQPNILIPCFQKHMGNFWTEEQQMLVKIFELIDKNNRLISEMNKLIANSQQLEKITIKSEKCSTQGQSNDLPAVREAIAHQEQLKIDPSFLQRLFGKRKYKYSLQAVQKFQETIYKQRNFNIHVKLTDKKNKAIRNCNLLTLCFAVCTCEAEWINENRVGEPFLKGKTEVQLYKGQAVFQKLYVRDVSRIYSQGKVVIVIYPKPSTLKYATTGPCQQCVNTQDIEPLIIQNVVIRAKRKQ